jgi:pimeloyl-ACP methyl ester carboxylesterase
VILLHGFPNAGIRGASRSSRWSKRAIASSCPISAVQFSDKPRGIHHYRLEALSADVVELIRSFGREKAIVGNDWGGMVAWHLAMHHREVVEKLIVLNALTRHLPARDSQ